MPIQLHLIIKGRQPNIEPKLHTCACRVSLWVCMYVCMYGVVCVSFVVVCGCQWLWETVVRRRSGVELTGKNRTGSLPVLTGSVLTFLTGSVGGAGYVG
jgi:hypothetical protein